MDDIAPQQPKIASYVLLEREGKFFAMCRENTGYMDGFYQPPAGKVDDGENLIAAAIREAKEEAGVVIKAEDLQLVHVSHRKSTSDQPYWVDFFFKCQKWQGEPCIGEPHKAKDMVWLKPEEMAYPDNGQTDAFFKQIFEKIQAGENVSTFGWNNEDRIVTVKEAV